MHSWFKVLQKTINTSCLKRKEELAFNSVLVEQAQKAIRSDPKSKESAGSSCACCKSSLDLAEGFFWSYDGQGLVRLPEIAIIRKLLSAKLLTELPCCLETQKLFQRVQPNVEEQSH